MVSVSPIADRRACVHHTTSPVAVDREHAPVRVRGNHLSSTADAAVVGTPAQANVAGPGAVGAGIHLPRDEPSSAYRSIELHRTHPSARYMLPSSTIGVAFEVPKRSGPADLESLSATVNTG